MTAAKGYDTPPYPSDGPGRHRHYRAPDVWNREVDEHLNDLDTEPERKDPLMPEQTAPSAWNQVANITYQEQLISSGDANSGPYGPGDVDARLSDEMAATRAALVTQLAQDSDVDEDQIRALAADAAWIHGHRADAEYVDYLAEPDWAAVREDQAAALEDEL